MVEVASIIGLPAFFLCVCMLGRFADTHLREEVKGLAASTIFSEFYSEKPISVGITAVYNLLERLYLRGTFKKFVVRAIVTSLITLSILLSLQLILHRDDFINKTYPFIKNVLLGHWWSVLLFVGIVFVDVLSAYQTIVFFRLSRGCNSLFELVLISIADIVLSFVMVILIVPLFLLPVFLWPSSGEDKDFYLAISSAPQPQPTGLDLGPLFPSKPSSSDKSEAPVHPNKTEEAVWYSHSYSVAFLSGDKQPPLKEAISSDKKTDLNFYSTGTFIGKPLYEEIAKALKSSDYIKSADVVDYYSNPLSSEYVLLKVSVRYNTTFRGIIRTYFGAISLVNLFDDRFGSAITLHGKTVGSDDVLWHYQLSESLNNFFGRDKVRVIKNCDDKISAIEIGENDVDEIKKCKAGIFIPVDSILHLAQYGKAIDDPRLEFPVAPFVFSSLSITFLFYYLVFSSVFFVLIRKTVDRTFVDAGFFMRYYFTIFSFFISVFICIPYIAIIHLT